MTDLISRAGAIERMKSMAGCTTCDNYNYVRCRACSWDDAMDIVDELPAVDAAPVVRCAYCKHCFDMGSDPMEPYDGESEWYCERFDRDTSAYEIDPYRFFCADGERRDDDALSGR